MVASVTMSRPIPQREPIIYETTEPPWIGSRVRTPCDVCRAHTVFIRVNTFLEPAWKCAKCSDVISWQQMFPVRLILEPINILQDPFGF